MKKNGKLIYCKSANNNVYLTVLMNQGYYRNIIASLLLMCSAFYSHADIILQEYFNSGSIPPGWTTNAIQGTAVWSVRNAPAFGSTSGTFYGVFDDALLGAGVTPNESTLNTPSLDCSGRTAVYMNYQHHWYGIESTHGYIEISNDGGTVWNTLIDYEKLTRGSLAIPQDTTLNITAFAANQADVRVRFRYWDNSLAGQYWYIDDITIYSDPDVGVTALIDPAYRLCASPTFSATEQVTVEITNFGFFPVSNIPIVCNVSGGIVASLTGTFPGPLAPGASANFTFATTIDMSAEAVYDFLSYTTLATDEYLGNDTLYSSRQQLVITYPYSMNFNGTEGGWHAEGQTPPNNNGRNFYHGAIPYLNGPQGEGDSWYVETSLSNNGTYIWVESPLFDFSALSNPHLFVDLKHSLHSSDFFRVEYSLNGGATWTQLGNGSTPNWYNGTNWWRNSYTNPVDTWTNYQSDLCVLAGQACVKLRFYGRPYYGNPTYPDYYKFSFDNVEIIDGPDAGIISYIDPVNIGCLFSANQVVTVEVHNYSCGPLTNIPVTSEITGAVTTTLTGTVPGPIPAGSSVSYTFPGTFDMSTIGIYNFNSYTSLVGDSYLPNDTLASSINVNQLLVNTFPYSESFDAGAAYWIAGGGAMPLNNGRNFNLGALPYLNGPQAQGDSWYVDATGNNGTYIWVE
ncbi:MAG: hypothetical protein COA33_007090, partial [Fluviicola sp.]|nr:hypothetical protein [Fluviicola sp.]